MRKCLFLVHGGDVCFERSMEAVWRARRVYSSSWGFNDEWFFVYLEKNAFEVGYESLSLKITLRLKPK